tara:strand:- start:53 stop:403 length:351 start_codon:yes stop_codon:yes gene_type:complete
MKITKIILFVVFSTFGFQISAQKIKNVKEVFEVSGNCDMCKTLIETTAISIEGVKSSRWNMLSKTMKVKFNPNLTSSDEIQKTIADIGYDTEKYRADDEVYEELHYCCQYERKPKK